MIGRFVAMRLVSDNTPRCKVTTAKQKQASTPSLNTTLRWSCIKSVPNRVLGKEPDQTARRFIYTPKEPSAMSEDRMKST